MPIAGLSGHDDIAGVRLVWHDRQMAEFESLSGEDTWDADFANDLVGCTLLVGLTYLDHDQQLIRRQQVSPAQRSDVYDRSSIGRYRTC